MAETLVYLIRRLGPDEISEQVRERAESLLMDPRMGHPDALLLDRILDRFARKLGSDIHQRDRFVDVFADLFRQQLRSLEAEHRHWEKNFVLRARSRANDAFRTARRKDKHELVIRSVNDESVPEPADFRDPEEEFFRGLARTPILDAAMESLTLRQREVLELFLDGHPQSGDSGPRESIQTLLEIKSKQAVYDFVQKALAKIRKNPEVLRLLEAQGRPLPPASQPAGPNGGES
ncbi:MAG TPA: hypothetical protein VF006_18160 [Longimicrobium sp.]